MANTALTRRLWRASPVISRQPPTPGSKSPSSSAAAIFFAASRAPTRALSGRGPNSIGMLATVMNGLALEQAVEAQGRQARALSAVPMPSLCESYSRRAALHHLAKGRVVIAAGGTGNPFFTTDTGAALRAAELSADAVLKATQVDGVYTADPKRDPAARRYDVLTHDQAIEQNLAIMDTAAFALAREKKIPIVVFSISRRGGDHRDARRRGPSYVYRSMTVAPSSLGAARTGALEVRAAGKSPSNGVRSCYYAFTNRNPKIDRLRPI